MFNAGLRHLRGTLAGLAGCALLSPLALSAPASASARAVSAAPSQYGFTTNAYGTSATLGVGGATSGSGASAAAGFYCARAGQNSSNSTAGVSIPALNTTVGAVTSQTSSTATSGLAQSGVSAINLLGGLVKAASVREKANVAVKSGTWTASATLTFSSISIAGKTIPDNPKANTYYTLPGIGYVYLNRQAKTVTSSGGSMDASAIVVQVNTANSLKVAVGSTIIVGHAFVQGGGPLSGTLSGSGYGASVASGVVNVSPTFAAGVGCMGTMGVTDTATGAGISAGPLTTGVITDTAAGTDTASDLSAATSATIAKATVATVLTVGTVKANASAAKVSGKIQASGGVSLAKLKIAGVVSVPVNPPPNYTIHLRGGTLVLNRQVKTANGIQVQAIYLNDSALGTIIIGSASAYVFS